MKWNGAEVKKLRLRLGWCTANFARRLNCSQELILKWESGEEEPDSQFFSDLKYLFDSAESNVVRMHQRLLAEQILKDRGLGQITTEDIYRITEES
ncbi:MAG: hypothetical protein H6624_17495 [Bdellovibrionaceae bacterium]|nr:hypothetical protein [Bdellovibrionales bacterium]MCB9086139.1 hypothetical protein [Pseudobdellovibrionaceae bacterium]